MAALDDDDDVAQGRQEAVADGKAPALCADTSGRLGHHRPALGHPLPQACVARRIRPVQTAGDDTDRWRARATRAFVGRPVDPEARARTPR